MEELEKLQCVKYYNTAMDAVHKGKNEFAKEFLQIAISTLTVEISLTADEKRVKKLSSMLQKARDALKEVKWILKEFSSEKTI